MGCSRFFRETAPGVEIVGVQPKDGSKIPGIRRWPEAYLPGIFDADAVDRIIDVSQAEAEDMTRQLASRKGLFCGVSSGGAVTSAIRLSQECQNAHIVAIICDRGDRYVSTDIFNPD